MEMNRHKNNRRYGVEIKIFEFLEGTTNTLVHQGYNIVPRSKSKDKLSEFFGKAIEYVDEYIDE